MWSSLTSCREFCQLRGLQIKQEAHPEFQQALSFANQYLWACTHSLRYKQQRPAYVNLDRGKSVNCLHFSTSPDPSSSSVSKCKDGGQYSYVFQTNIRTTCFNKPSILRSQDIKVLTCGSFFFSSPLPSSCRGVIRYVCCVF